MVSRGASQGWSGVAVDTGTLLAIVLMALATYATRAGGLIAVWREEGIYPYPATDASPVVAMMDTYGVCRVPCTRPKIPGRIPWLLMP